MNDYADVIKTLRMVNDVFLPWLQLIVLGYIAIGVNRKRDHRG